MRKQFGFVLLTVVFVLMAVPGAAISAVMSGDGYTMEASVVSGGGGRMTSVGYAMTATLGQPSPLGTVTSPDFELKSGFWECLSLGKIGNTLVPAIYLLLLGDDS